VWVEQKANMNTQKHSQHPPLHYPKPRNDPQQHKKNSEKVSSARLDEILSNSPKQNAHGQICSFIVFCLSKKTHQNPKNPSKSTVREKQQSKE